MEPPDRSRSEGEVERLHDLVWRTSESEQRYRSLVEAQIELVVQRDAEGRITFANQGFAALLDTTPEGLLGTTREAEVVERGEMRHRADGARLVDLAILPAGGGAVRWFAFVETVTAGRDGRPEVLRAGRDVTERVESARSLEEARSRAEAASVAKSRFIASVSHEFRTPLNGIMGMADLMLDTSLSPEQRTYAEAVKTSGEALLSLIDGILDFSKIEAGRLDLAAEPFDPAALVESVVELLAPRAQDKGLEIAADIETLPARLIGDADRVRQVLINLAGNAVKFTEAGGVGVTAAWDEAGFTVAVHDTGPGIPEERLPLLFQEFEQGDGSASRRHEGTGLGLAITRRLVDRMGGWLDVTSRPGEGSCFRVRLPLRQAPGHARPQPPSLAGQRVLVVAAAAFEAPYIARRLGRAGAEAVVVETADEAAAILSKEAFDAVIADRALGDSTVRGIAAAAREAGVGRSIVLLSRSTARFRLASRGRLRSLPDQARAPHLTPRAPRRADAAADAGSARPRRHPATLVAATAGATGRGQPDQRVARHQGPRTPRCCRALGTGRGGGGRTAPGSGGWWTTVRRRPRRYPYADSRWARSSPAGARPRSHAPSAAAAPRGPDRQRPGRGSGGGSSCRLRRLPVEAPRPQGLAAASRCAGGVSVLGDAAAFATNLDHPRAAKRLFGDRHERRLRADRCAWWAPTFL